MVYKLKFWLGRIRNFSNLKIIITDQGLRTLEEGQIGKNETLIKENKTATLFFVLCMLIYENISILRAAYNF